MITSGLWGKLDDLNSPETIGVIFMVADDVVFHLGHQRETEFAERALMNTEGHGDTVTLIRSDFQKRRSVRHRREVSSRSA